MPSSSDNSTNQTPPASTSADSLAVNPSSSANQPLDKIRIAEDFPDPCGPLKLGNDQTVFLVDMLWSLHRATNIGQLLGRIRCPLLHSTMITNDPGSLIPLQTVQPARQLIALVFSRVLE